MNENFTNNQTRRVALKTISDNDYENGKEYNKDDTKKPFKIIIRYRKL